MEIVAFLVFGLVVWWIPACIAYKKGRRFWTWFIYEGVQKDSFAARRESSMPV